MDSNNNTFLCSKGFSLVELIIVIAITAVLVGVIAPMFVMYVESSRESVDIQNMDSAYQLAYAVYAEDAEAVGTYYYYFDGNEIGKATPSLGYGRGTAKNRHTVYEHACCPDGVYDPAQDYTGRYLMIIFPDTQGEMVVHVHWSN